jgi:hypothetical protein
MSMRHVLSSVLFCASVAALSLTGCVTSSASRGGAPPQWVTDKDSVYPEDEFLAEVGEGDGLKAAKSEAAAAIARIFRNKVSVDTTVTTRYTELTGEGGETLGLVNQTDFDQTIGQASDETLVNMRYGESWTDSLGRVYTVAYLDRAETGNLYRQRIMDNDDRISELMERARAQDEPLRRFAFFDAALVMSEVNRVLLEQLEIINMPMARSYMPAYELGDLRAAKADQASALKIRVEASGDPEGRVTAVMTDWVAERGFSVSDGGDMFLSAVVNVVPVQLDNGYENLAWELNLMLMDSFGYPAITLPRQGRSTGISASAAEARVYADMSEVIAREFDREFTAYLASFLEK